MKRLIVQKTIQSDRPRQNLANSKAAIRNWLREKDKSRLLQNTPGRAEHKEHYGALKNDSHPENHATLSRLDKKNIKEHNLAQTASLETMIPNCLNTLPSTFLLICSRTFSNVTTSVIHHYITTCKTSSESYVEVKARFTVYVKFRKINSNLTVTLATDETAVLFDCLDGRCIEKRRANDFIIVSDSHENMLTPVCVNALSDG